VFDNQQLGEYKSLTPTYLLKQDTSQLPDIDVSTVKKYLLNRKAQEFTSTSLRHYKLSRAYQHLDANYICNVNLCAIKVSCISPTVVMRPRLNTYMQFSTNKLGNHMVDFAHVQLG
jgi:hypothetical protein